MIRLPCICGAGVDEPPEAHSSRCLENQVHAAKVLISEHHAVGVMDGVLIGDKCPVCATLRGVLA